jgi:hypothetical protein
VLITKVVQNHIIYLLANFKIFLKLLDIFLDYFPVYVYRKRVKKYSKSFSILLGSTHQPSLVTAMWVTPPFSSPLDSDSHATLTLPHRRVGLAYQRHPSSPIVIASPALCHSFAVQKPSSMPCQRPPQLAHSPPHALQPGAPF